MSALAGGTDPEICCDDPSGKLPLERMQVGWRYPRAVLWLCVPGWCWRSTSGCNLPTCCHTACLWGYSEVSWICSSFVLWSCTHVAQGALLAGDYLMGQQAWSWQRLSGSSRRAVWAHPRETVLWEAHACNGSCAAKRFLHHHVQSPHVLALQWQRSISTAALNTMCPSWLTGRAFGSGAAQARVKGCQCSPPYCTKQWGHLVTSFAFIRHLPCGLEKNASTTASKNVCQRLVYFSVPPNFLEKPYRTGINLSILKTWAFLNAEFSTLYVFS